MTTNKKIRVCVAGATGWAGSELCRGIVLTDDLELVSAVSRTNANKDLNAVLNLSHDKNIPIFGTIEEALSVPCDVLVDYTKPDIAKHQVLTAIHQGVHVVIGTSGLSDADYEEINSIAQKKKKAVLAVGNFAISVVLLNKFAEMAAKYMPNWEIIDYASDRKIDSPSGSTLELANRLSKVRESVKTVAIEDTKGVKETRGADINGMQVHAVRLPGFVIALETIFGLEDEKLTIKHEAGNSAKPYVQGALLAIRKVGTFTGLKRGLDSVMDFND
ncbi:4-hydroxy-tetrahydrodipicolinate reductase [Pedobacter cryoconitis]|uniref:4-hydroxy-tetrahydrodipicolinate reductase n=1 Tax=Pedobacter cryoconitis TaxID=188932 RepID=A0A7W9DXF3_9SPHI|nr:4-hydroxy-tetrahydrodipicolinate reductase [Pedobacter cryoconitis]MBB5634836.1 4-hydroxy-tetrahydrodipicolinate reductase [Pedobacter cryoconitis]